MRLCDAMLMTSEFEGMSILMLEALGSGLPVVTTDSGEARSILKSEQCGCVVDEHSPQSLAEALLDVLRQSSDSTPKACAQAVSDYQPNIILPSFFDTLRGIV